MDLQNTERPDLKTALTRANELVRQVVGAVIGAEALVIEGRTERGPTLRIIVPGNKMGLVIGRGGQLIKAVDLIYCTMLHQVTSPPHLVVQAREEAGFKGPGGNGRAASDDVPENGTSDEAN